PIRARLLAYAEKIGAPANIRNRAAELMAQPKGALPHDDHFHVRLGCPSGMQECIEQPQARHGHHHGAVAVAGHSAPSAHAAHHETKPAAARPAPRQAAPPKKSERDEEAAKSEASAPPLGPVVPVLDPGGIAPPPDAPKPPQAPAAAPTPDPID